MASSRLEILKSMVIQNPRDSFSRYGLAMEYRNAGDLEGAIREFQSLMDLDPDYVPAYFHAGQTLFGLGRVEEARTVYRNGLAAASRKGDQHAHREIQAALELLE
jgi:tetratricopeptide (TPR) repeat protein